MSEDLDYVKNRLESQIEWYSKKASENKSRFHTLQIIIIIIGALISVVNVIDFAELEVRIISAIFGATITILTGIIQLIKYHENWIMYRSTEEVLKKEKYSYLNEVGEYSGLASDIRLKRLVENVESIISNQNVVYFITHKRTEG